MFYPVDALCREHLYKARTGDTDFEDILYEFYSICAPNYFLLRADLFGCTKYMMLVVMTIIATLHSFIYKW